MNAKQLLIAWIVAVIIVWLLLTHPWSDVLRIGVSTVIIGALLVYTVRKRK